MSEMIKDGTGTGFITKVNSLNRLFVDSISTDDAIAANKAGDAYNINSGVINLSDAVDTPVLYLKNTGDPTINISAIAVGIGPTTGGSGGIPKITIIRNPTVGTIITSTPTNADIVSNRNYQQIKMRFSKLPICSIHNNK